MCSIGPRLEETWVSLGVDKNRANTGAGIFALWFVEKSIEWADLVASQPNGLYNSQFSALFNDRQESLSYRYLTYQYRQMSMLLMVCHAWVMRACARIIDNNAPTSCELPNNTRHTPVHSAQRSSFEYNCSASSLGVLPNSAIATAPAVWPRWRAAVPGRWTQLPWAGRCALVAGGWKVRSRGAQPSSRGMVS